MLCGVVRSAPRELRQISRGFMELDAHIRVWSDLFSKSTHYKPNTKSEHIDRNAHSRDGDTRSTFPGIRFEVQRLGHMELETWRQILMKNVLRYLGGEMRG